MKILIILLMFVFTIYIIEKMSHAKEKEFRNAGTNNKYYLSMAVIASVYLVCGTTMVFWG